MDDGNERVSARLLFQTCIGQFRFPISADSPHMHAVNFHNFIIRQRETKFHNKSYGRGASFFFRLYAAATIKINRYNARNGRRYSALTAAVLLWTNFD